MGLLTGKLQKNCSSQEAVGAGSEQIGQPGCGVDDVLEVVEEEQQQLVCEVLGEAVPCLPAACEASSSTSAGSRNE